ncbi:MAG: DUF1844 domain-containing protein [Nitrospinota bacterium]
MAEEEKKPERGFTVTDRRRATQGFEESAAQAPADRPPPREAAPALEEGGEGGPAQEVSLELLLGLLQSNALLSLGVLPDARGQGGAKDPARARLFIELVALLREKTRGNLTPQEEALVEDVLSGLRLLYVEEAG